MATAYYSIKDLDHDPELAAALGNMVLAWAYAEQRLLGTLARITGIGLNMSLAGYFSVPTFEARTKLIRALITEWKTSQFDKEAIGRVVDKISKLARARNQWIHGDWCATHAKDLTVIFNHRVPVESSERRKPVKAADVVNHSEAVKARTDELSKLIDWSSLEG